MVNAASGTLILYIKGHGSSIFRDGLRLVLILFLASAALWAQVEFITTLISIGATSGCQVALIFSLVFDQVGRSLIEQYLVWAVGNGAEKASADHVFSQILVLVRFIVGFVFVGFAKPTFMPICVARSSVLPVAIAVIVLDALILGTLAVRAFSGGLVSDVSQDGQTAQRSRAILWTIAGLGVWMGASIPMLLGINSIDFIYRTAVPSAGLAVLISESERHSPLKSVLTT